MGFGLKERVSVSKSRVLSQRVSFCLKSGFMFQEGVSFRKKVGICPSQELWFQSFKRIGFSLSQENEFLSVSREWVSVSRKWVFLT